MKTILLAVATMLFATPLAAQPTAMAPPQPETAYASPSIALAPAGSGTEQWERFMDQIMVRNVVSPALYPVLPRPERANGRAVIVVPGGGYRFVSIDSEGFRVANALAAEGYTAFVLKYRTLETPRETAAYMADMAKLFGALGKAKLQDLPAAVDDLSAAVRLVRERAGEWKLDPAHIDVIGFSAGARTAIRFVEGKDEANRIAGVGLIYPPMSETVNGGPRPPMFLAMAIDDPLFGDGGLALPDAWLRQSKKAEIHLYSGGSHGFGMRPQGTTSDMWIDQYKAWLTRR